MRIISKTGPLHNPADRDHCLQYMVAVSLMHCARIRRASKPCPSPSSWIGWPTTKNSHDRRVKDMFKHGRIALSVGVAFCIIASCAPATRSETSDGLAGPT